MMPRGTAVAEFDDYPSAQAAIARLARGDFSLTEASIVGTNLATVERVTGRLSYARVAAAGAGSGVWLGMFVGMFWLISGGGEVSLQVFVAAALLGAAFGMLFGVVSYSLTRRRRDYTSVMQVVATRYAVIVPDQFAEHARAILGLAASDD